MPKVIGLAKTLGVKGMKGFHESLYQCSHELFGLSRDEFAEKWRPKLDEETGTLRGYMQPTAEALFEQWKTCRDPNWLYSHPEYKWDSIGCSTFQSCVTTASGIGLLRKHGYPSPKKIFDWGAGPGFSSLMLAKNFPDSEVHFNECNADLIAVFEWFKASSGLTNLKVVSKPEGEYDVIQAYEISEHFSSSTKGVGDPIGPQDAVLQYVTKPDAYFLHSSCWSVENRYFTLGHFLHSEIDGVIHPNTRVGKFFRAAMGLRGWEILGAGWNSRPHLYCKRVH